MLSRFRVFYDTDTGKTTDRYINTSRFSTYDNRISDGKSVILRSSMNYQMPKFFSMKTVVARLKHHSAKANYKLFSALNEIKQPLVWEYLATIALGSPRYVDMSFYHTGSENLTYTGELINLDTHLELAKQGIFLTVFAKTPVDKKPIIPSDAIEEMQKKRDGLLNNVHKHIKGPLSKYKVEPVPRWSLCDISSVITGNSLHSFVESVNERLDEFRGEYGASTGNLPGDPDPDHEAEVPNCIEGHAYSMPSRVRSDVLMPRSENE